MPRYRYEATDASGVPIHGTAEAADEAALDEQMQGRRLRLISCTELSLESLMDANRVALPRLYQLRVGEQLREAVLTGLPAHDAVRAIAAEPLSHPMLGLAPWLQVVAVIVAATMTLAWWLTGACQQAATATVLTAVVIVPLLWLWLRWVFQGRPQQLLRTLADRLEAGAGIPTALVSGMPSELRCVMASDIDDASKAKVAADLMPGLLGTSLRAHQFVLTLIGPLVLLCVVAIGIHSTLLFVIPQFRRIFSDFGTQLPAMTQLVVTLSDFVVYLGSTTWVVVTVSLIVGLTVLAIGLIRGWVSEFCEAIPVLGMAFRWAMQARVARILSSMIRNDCPYADSLKAATAGSGFRNVREHGVAMAQELESNSGVVFPTRQLSGLPLSMLFVTDPGPAPEERKAAIADTFQGLSEMLEAATVGQGRLLAVIIQFFTILLTGVVVGLGVIGMFLPLIKLINDLS